VIMSEGYGDAVPGSADEGVVIIGMILFCPFHPSTLGYSDYDVFLESDRGPQVYRFKK
jgi:hypothetical protein